MKLQLLKQASEQPLLQLAVHLVAVLVLINSLPFQCADYVLTRFSKRYCHTCNLKLGMHVAGVSQLNEPEFLKNEQGTRNINVTLVSSLNERCQ